MAKLKQGKLTRVTYWIAILAIWGIMAVLMLAGNTPGEPISNVRLILLMVMLIFYIAALIMRLRDVGQSMGFAVICILVPIFVFVIGFLPSLERQVPVAGKNENSGNAKH